jgi:hypothetical protein
MCSGAIFVLACGHKITHQTATTCNANHSPITFLKDSCSECYPPIRIWNINQKYDALREETMEKIRRATAEKRFQDVDELRRVSRFNEVERIEELSRWKKIEYPWAKVVWPGKEEE